MRYLLSRLFPQDHARYLIGDAFFRKAESIFASAWGRSPSRSWRVENDGFP
jgi:hypothetical protein